MRKKTNQDNNVRSGIFGVFALKYIEENYPQEMNQLKLIGSLESFIEEAATIGSNTNVELIQNGRDTFSAKEEAHSEIEKYIDKNIEDYA